MSNEHKEEVKPTTGDATDAAVDEQMEHQEQTDQEEQAAGETKARKSAGFWLFIFSLALLVAIVFIYVPKDTRDHYLNMAETFISETLVKEPAPIVENQPEPAASQATEAELPAVEPEPEAEPEPAPTTVVPVVVTTGASSEEVERLLTAMEGLRGEIQSLQQEQRSLQASQAEMQRMQLRTRLHWITNPANHLPQLHLAWEEIALMPALSADERKLAEKMQALSKQRTEDLNRWQQTLRREADALMVKEQENFIPAFENSWLNWIAGQFSVRPSLNQQERQDADLRREMISISHNLELERWPDPKQWLELRSRLQLRLVETTENEADNNQPVQLNLPQSFEGVMSDMKELRSSATLWLESM